jgi:LysM repeat protein
MLSLRPTLICLLTGSFLLFACAPGAATPDSAYTPPAEPVPYLTLTPSPTMTEVPLATLETPLPSPTPFLYKVTSEDTMSSIAEKFGISLDDLIAANPDVVPSAMSVGQELRIPSSSGGSSGESTPTPVLLNVTQVSCYSTAEGGLWCFVLVHNDYPDRLENLSAQVSLLGGDGRTISSQMAISPLNILPPGEAIPLTVFFPPEAPSEARPSVQILTGIRLLPDDNRYLNAVLQNTLVKVDWSGKIALLSGYASLPQKSKSANQVWVAAVAYDAAGRVVGFRRWESSKKLDGGGSLPFEFTVSSLAGAIARVEFLVEARP